MEVLVQTKKKLSAGENESPEPIVYTFSIMNERWKKFCNHPIMQENDTRTIAAGLLIVLTGYGGVLNKYLVNVPANRMREWKVQPFHVILPLQLIKPLMHRKAIWTFFHHLKLKKTLKTLYSKSGDGKSIFVYWKQSLDITFRWQLKLDKGKCDIPQQSNGKITSLIFLFCPPIN